jgi:hypothetical protein
MSRTEAGPEAELLDQLRRLGAPADLARALLGVGENAPSVALCETCRRAYAPEQLGTEIGNGCCLCRQCGADLTESLLAHARTCPNLAPQRPLARMTSISGSTIPPAASERFAARRRIRLGLDAHAARGTERA